MKVPSFNYKGASAVGCFLIEICRNPQGQTSKENEAKI